MKPQVDIYKHNNIQKIVKTSVWIASENCGRCSVTVGDRKTKEMSRCSNSRRSPS